MASPTCGRRVSSLWLALGLLLHLAGWASAKPNILIILTDDQDEHMESVQNMPQLQRLIVNEGTTHTSHFCSIALCCPSRVNMWTGRYSHNTNVTDVSLPYGGYPRIVDEGINDSYLPIWMQNAGYSTYYVGKLWNGHSVNNYNAPFVNGFDGSDFAVGPQQYLYFNTSFVRNGNPPVYETNYSPDVVADKTYGFLQEALEGEKPFFLVSAPVAPHVQTRVMGMGEGRGEPPPSAARHEGLFQDYIIPRGDNFNPSKPGGAAYYRRIPPLNQTVIDYNDEWQRKRLRALQAVDDMVGNLTETLAAAGQLENTYIIFTTDNGYHLSQHRLFGGKRCGLDTDIKIPFIVRGPGVAAGAVDDRISSHVDISPTVLALAEAGSRDEFDGAPMPFTGDFPTGRTEHVAVEHWGMGLYEGVYGKYGTAGSEGRSYRNNTYKSVRVVNEGYSMYYSVWCNGEHEYYDMVDDPGQLDNLFVEPDLADGYTFAGRPFEQLSARLDTLLLVLKSCVTDSCRQPWSTLFPSGGVSSLQEAMDEQYDSFFEDQPRVEYEACAKGYIPELEGPMDPNVFGEGGRRMLEAREDDWMGETIWNLMD